MPIQHRQNHMEVRRQDLRRIPIVPPGQSAAVEEKGNVFILFAILNDSHGVHLGFSFIVPVVAKGRKEKESRLG